MVDNYIEIMRELTNREKKLQDIIDLRREKATENDIMLKVLKVIDVLGNKELGYDYNYSEYKDTQFILKLDSNYIKIDLEIQPMEHDYVFLGFYDSVNKGRVDLYCPEEKWEKHLDELFEKAKEKERLDEIKDIKLTQERLIRDWKINPEEII